MLPGSVHSDDRKNAQRECETLFQSFWEVIAIHAMWVNLPNKARAANSKLLQLRTAFEVGLKVPKTIVANDPDKIKNFFIQCEGEIIYKTLHPMSWVNENDVRFTYTKEISLEALPSDAVLKMTPGIFQKKMQKAYELRVTYFGNYPVVVKLHSQDHPKGRMDWRYLPTQELIVTKYSLPDLIDRQCRAFMEKLGIIFGCFDFIVTPDNQYYFLEVNESGQFLWIEAINPEIQMLDIFTEFLINKKPTFRWTKRSDSISLSDFRKEADVLLKRAADLHVS